MADCTGEAAALAKDQSDLPRLEIANPADRPPYCITLETLIAFAARVKAHAAACPNSDFVHQVAEWEKSRDQLQPALQPVPLQADDVAVRESVVPIE